MFTRNRSAAALLLAFCLCAFLGLGARAQEPRTAEGETQDDSDYKVTFGRAVGMPGEAVAVSLFFTRRSGVPNVHNLRVRLSFPTAVLSYNKAESAYLARRAGVEIKAVPGRSENDGTLDLTFTLPATSDQEFPSGQIAYVHFTVASEAKGGAFSLRPEVWIEDKLATSPELRARVEDAKVVVSTSPILVGCFFFSH